MPIIAMLVLAFVSVLLLVSFAVGTYLTFKASIILGAVFLLTCWIRRISILFAFGEIKVRLSMLPMIVAILYVFGCPEFCNAIVKWLYIPF